eukprot:1828973-Rhodomonas_salina.1
MRRSNSGASGSYRVYTAPLLSVALRTGAPPSVVRGSTEANAQQQRGDSLVFVLTTVTCCRAVPEAALLRLLVHDLDGLPPDKQHSDLPCGGRIAG